MVCIIINGFQAEQSILIVPGQKKKTDESDMQMLLHEVAINNY